MIPAAFERLGKLRDTIHYYYKGKGEELEKIKDESQQAYTTEDAARNASFAQEDQQMSKAQEGVDAALVDKSLENEKSQKYHKEEAERLQAEHQAKLEQAKIENEQRQKELLAILAKSDNPKINAPTSSKNEYKKEENLRIDTDNIIKTNPTKKTEEAKTSSGSKFGKGFGKNFGKPRK